MYLNILKKDLKRKKTMNIILLIFIILATMFVSSSVNNILNVTSALDNYLDMANAPDYLAATKNKIFETDLTAIFNSAKSIENYSVEKLLFLAPKNFIFENEKITALGGTNIIQSDEKLSLNYFLADGRKLEKVEPGEIYITEGKAEKIGLKKGDKFTIEIDGIKNEFLFAGEIKDVIFGSKSMQIQRYIISSKDYEKYILNPKTDKIYGGNLIYIHTTNIENTLSEIKLLTDNSILNMDRSYMKFCYILDMVVTGILLVVSIILITIAFVILRFTITFTLAEEFREIGVMKAIGIRNLKIRGLYLVKYTALSITGAVIGLILSFPFGNMLMNVSSTSIILSNQNSIFINMFCVVIVVFVILMFCFGCTGKVKKMKPIDAIRNGQTGERYRKKNYMKLGKSKLPSTSFLALNDIVSSPKRFCIIIVIFFLCTSLLLVLSVTVSTMKSGSLYRVLSIADSDVVVGDAPAAFSIENGHEELEKFLLNLEDKLEKNGMPASCMKEMMFSLPVSFAGNKANLPIYQGTGTTMDMYEYIEGTVPKNANEIAITKISANKIKATIGDTITIKTIDGDKNYMITAFFQSLHSNGDGIRLQTNEKINYIQSYHEINTQIVFTDHPDKEEIEIRVEKIKENFPEFETVETSAKFISDMLGVTETLNAIKILIAIITILLVALISVLMERSFIEKEQGEIGLMKAIGIRDEKIYLYHALRFLFIGMISVIISEIFVIPLTHLCIDSLFKMMGLETGVDYVINPMETYIIFPAIVFITTMTGAYLTSRYIRNYSKITCTS